MRARSGGASFRWSPKTRQRCGSCRRCCGTSRRALQTLVDLDFVVTNLEQELDEAEEEIKASKQAVLELESISEEADRHLESLRLVQDAFKVESKENGGLSELRVATIDDVHGGVLPGVNVRQALIQDPNLQPKSRTATVTSHLADRHRGASSGGPDPRPPDKREPPSTRNAGGDSRSRSGVRRHNAAHVTEDDLKSIPRTTRGHISLSAINDALDQVHTYARRKAARIERERRTKSQIYRYDSSGRKPPKPSGHGIGEDEENDGSSAPVLLTEQELRQACAFFRSGEATARSLLLILCAVHRLKQARGGKNGLVYYHIPEQQQQQQQQSTQQSTQQSAQNEPEKLQQPDPSTAPLQSSNPLLLRIRRHRQQQQQHVTI
jgi:hypothetical protein